MHSIKIVSDGQPTQIWGTMPRGIETEIIHAWSVKKSLKNEEMKRFGKLRV